LDWQKLTFLRYGTKIIVKGQKPLNSWRAIANALLITPAAAAA
jgi:hypothetical protein